MNVRMCCVLLGLGWAAPCLASQPEASAPEPLLTVEDLHRLDRQNAMWRLVDPADDVDTNLRRWREHGFAIGEIAALAPQLTAWWSPEAERHFGWLDAEAIEQIRDVDRVFVVRMRAARLRAATGVEAGSPPAESVNTVNRRWRQAILRALDDDELAEFRLMNSGAAREIAGMLVGVTRSTAEDRRLFQLERDFQLAYGGVSDAFRTPGVAGREARLDHLAAVREVLGDERFAWYLKNLDPEFANMQATLATIGGQAARQAVDLWWMKERLILERLSKRLGGLEWETAVAGARTRVGGILGEANLALYLAQDDSRWLKAY